MIPREEQETIINFSPVEDKVSIFTNMPGIMRRYRKFLSVEGVTVLRDTIDAFEIAVPKDRFLVSVRTPRVLTEEQKEKARERMKLILSKEVKRNE